MDEKHIPSLSDIKILVTIQYLNERGYYPLHTGILKILNGVVDFETKDFIDCPTFQSLISFNAKKISRSLLLLHRYNYVKKVYDPETDKLYYALDEKGKALLLKKKYHYKRSKKQEKTTIVKINVIK